MRRTRIGGDSWDGVEVPLGEDAERYEIDILDGSDVVRTLAATTPSRHLHRRRADRRLRRPAVRHLVRVYQLSATFGRGTPASQRRC